VGGATGPVLIKGTPNVSLKDRSLKLQAGSTQSQTASATGTPLTVRSNYKQRYEDYKKSIKGLKDFTAFEWEEIDREADREWYDQDEGADYVDELHADK
jgi:hypothetical protein